MWLRKRRDVFILDAVNCGYTEADAISWWHWLYSKAVGVGNGSAEGTDSGEQHDDALWIKQWVLLDWATVGREEVDQVNRRLECVSRSLTYLCRHGALAEGYHMDNRGGIRVAEVLQYGGRLFRNGISETDVRSAVWEYHKPSSERKQRLKLYLDDDLQLRVKAVQGHDSTVGAGIQDEIAFTQVWYPDNAVCCHGTYRERWETIQRQGIDRMQRKHIHFADHILAKNECDKQILIMLNVNMWLRDGGTLFKTENNMFVTPGFSGIVPPQYFREVLQIRPTTKVLWDRSWKRPRSW